MDEQGTTTTTTKNSHREIKEQNPTNSSHQRDGRGPGRKGLQRGGTLGLDFL